MWEDVNDGFSGGRSDALFPVLPICFIHDEESNQHAGIHVIDIKPSQPSRMVRVQLVLRVELPVVAARESWTRMVGIEVEEMLILNANKVMRLSRSAAVGFAMC